MNGYRKEHKYIVDDAFIKEVRNRVSSVMSIDANQTGDSYGIRSIYLDSPDYRCLKENAAGVSTREKYRIRSYNCLDSKIAAEIKIRHRDTISKMSVDIPKDIYEAIVSRDNVAACNGLIKLITDIDQRISDCRDNEALVQLNMLKKRAAQKYISKLSGSLYSPAVIVDYERCAYVYEQCNVRITFDRNVGASREYSRFFDSSLKCIPAIDNQMHVMEIKYDEFLPDEISALLSGLGLKRESCSKYVRCMQVY